MIWIYLLRDIAKLGRKAKAQTPDSPCFRTTGTAFCFSEDDSTEDAAAFLSTILWIKMDREEV